MPQQLSLLPQPMPQQLSLLPLSRALQRSASASSDCRLIVVVKLARANPPTRLEGRSSFQPRAAARCSDLPWLCPRSTTLPSAAARCSVLPRLCTNRVRAQPKPRGQSPFLPLPPLLLSPLLPQPMPQQLSLLLLPLPTQLLPPLQLKPQGLRPSHEGAAPACDATAVVVRSDHRRWLRRVQLESARAPPKQ
jgi:hypothetical protein